MKRLALFVFETLCFLITTCTITYADVVIDKPSPLPSPSSSSFPLFIYAFGVVAAVIIALLIIRFVKKRKTK